MEIILNGVQEEGGTVTKMETYVFAAILVVLVRRPLGVAWSLTRLLWQASRVVYHATRLITVKGKV
jgi:hypothetical protein